MPLFTSLRIWYVRWLALSLGSTPSKSCVLLTPLFFRPSPCHGRVTGASSAESWMAVPSPEDGPMLLTRGTISDWSSDDNHPRAAEPVDFVLFDAEGDKKVFSRLNMGRSQQDGVQGY